MTDRPLSAGEIAAMLADQLGQHVTAYLLGAADAQQIAAYANGDRVSHLHAKRLRAGFEIVQMIEAAHDAATAKAWLFGTNARLGDQAPIDAISHAITTRQLVEIQRAARAFVHHQA